ncbi:MAG: hypothetical protein ACXAAH_05805 [Promethearchaeota archaeon]
MADIFNNDSSEKNPNEYLCVVYVLYFDEKKGQIPLLMYPDDGFRNNKKYMRPIHYHPVWFLETEDLDHIDLEYKGYTFFGKKFSAKSERQKRRAGLEIQTPETIVLIVSLPIELTIFGDDLIRKLTEQVRSKFEDQFFEVIKSEIARDTIIKTPKIQEIITEGTKTKVFIRELIDKVVKEHFSSVIQKKSGSPSLKTQKAISYFSLKGFELSPLSNVKGENGFSSIELFDPTKQKSSDEILLSITKINLIENSQEIEITIQNNTKEELKNISITITHVKEFFEKEVMTQEVDFWFPQEELLFVSPIISHIEEYLVSIEKQDGNGNRQKILNQRIDINLINKITN